MRFLDHTQRRITVCRTLLDKWSACRTDPYLHNTQHSHQTNISCPWWDWNPELSTRAAADLCLRPRGKWDRQLIFNQIFVYNKYDFCYGFII